MTPEPPRLTPQLTPPKHSAPHVCQRAGRLRWLVTDSGPRSMGQILEILGEPPEALAEGRVFIDRRRASSGDWGPLAPGVRVEVVAGTQEARQPVMLEGRRGLVIVYKPAGIPTEPTRTSGVTTVVAAVARQLACPASQVHAISRLDQGASGLMLCATSRAGRAHAAQSDAIRLRKGYFALVAGGEGERAGEWAWPLRGPRDSAPKPAISRYWRLAGSAESVRWGTNNRPIALLALEAVTGRFHQLRKHAAAAGCPLLGDRAHGGPSKITLADGAVLGLSRLALHAGAVQLVDVDGGPWSVHAPLPADLVATWVKLGGVAGDWSPSCGPFAEPL